MDRREFIKLLSLLAIPTITNHSIAEVQPAPRSALEAVGELGAADTNGVRLPQGFRSRIVARSGVRPIADKAHVWHDLPDGGACLAMDDGGWLYLSNSEVANNGGSVSVLRFDADATLIDTYPILTGTSRNCAGGLTPWNTWLSCEEVSLGMVWECDPLGKNEARSLPALGAFAHEAVAIDPVRKQLYLTEDKMDGGLYRFTPASILSDGRYNLEEGTLEVARIDSDGQMRWLAIDDPDALESPTRQQAAGMTEFAGGEGIVYFDGMISFATKGDNRIWRYDVAKQHISIHYDAARYARPVLTGVDNITTSFDGDLVVSEDGGDLQIVAITRQSRILPLVQLEGHGRSELCGPAFSPDGQRLYFASQRGTTGSGSDGMIFEITGPFHS